MLSAFFSDFVWCSFGSHDPFAPAFVPGTRLNPGQHAAPSPVERTVFFTLDFFADDFFAEVLLAVFLLAAFFAVFFAAFFVAMPR